MKFTTTFAIVAVAAAATVGAKPSHTNAERMARGLPPLAPARRWDPTGVSAARRSSPSGISNSCNTGPVQCCNSVTKASSPIVSPILGLLGVVVGHDVLVGFQCSPVGALGLGHNSCTQQPVCCEGNNFNGLVVVGCSPININL
ncbi:hydrophobin [Pholiota molesta]|nr:hydrophobin [Pholiota molesta]